LDRNQANQEYLMSDFDAVGSIDLFRASCIQVSPDCRWTIN
jgi:hypothetical protein